MKLIIIPALVDNYIWILSSYNRDCIIIDPGIAEPVLQFLSLNKIKPIAILLTHHHYDHVNGVNELLKYFPKLKVYGPLETKSKGTNNIIKEGDYLKFAGFSLQVFAVPGHTLGHVAYYQQPYLFCGDTIFSGGCGRVFEGTLQQMYYSIEKIKLLPDDTLICCGHEYTAENMKFISNLLPYDYEIQAYTRVVNNKCANKQPTVPSQLNIEKRINIFFRTADPDLQKLLGFSPNICTNFEVFYKMRLIKDRFKI